MTTAHRTQNYPKSKETRKESSFEPSGELWPVAFFELGLLTSRTRKEYIFIASSHQIGGHVLWRLEERNPLDLGGKA